MNTKKITLKELIKLDPDYIAINELDKETPWIYASKDFEVNVNGDIEKINKQFRVDMPILITNNTRDAPKPRSMGFHQYRDLETLLCLLAHKPENLHIDYHYSNQSDNMRKHGIDQETISINAFKGKRVFRVRFTSPRSVNNINQFAYIAHF